MNGSAPGGPLEGVDGFWERLDAALETVGEEARTPPPGARVGAVLVLLEDGPDADADGPRLVLTRRRPDLRSHPGQLSFAGGRLEPGETPTVAALREAGEEIGLDPTSVEVLGHGPTFYVPPSRFWVVPVVGRWHTPHPLVPEPSEVAEVLHVGLGTLTDERRWRHTPIGPREGSTWAWRLDDDLLWGATALVVRMLLDAALPGWTGGTVPEALGPGRAESPWVDTPRLPRRARLGAVAPEREQAEVPHAGVAMQRAARAGVDVAAGGPVPRAERAGEVVAVAVAAMLDAGGRPPDAGPITVLAGPSSNGAAGLVAARRLAAAGRTVQVVTVGDPRLPEQAGALAALGVPVTPLDDHPLDDNVGPGVLVVDAMLGIGMRPPLHGRPARAATWLRRHDVPVLAVDLPSGLSADEGLVGTCVTADVTVALGLPSPACRASAVQAFLGDLHLADLGVTPSDWAELGVQGVPGDLFASGSLVRLVTDAVPGDAGTPAQTA